MKADPISVGKVLSENHRFVVPIYQRTYAWTEQKQLEPLFAQIEAKAEERLQKGKVDFPHYMGSLLVIPEGEATFRRVQAFDIVDGQQRLTTFHLCFAALRDIARSRGFEDLSVKLENLLLNSKDATEADGKHGRYKLHPTAFDRCHFRAIIDSTSDELRAKYSKYFYKNGKIIKGGTPNPLAAYWFFLSRVQAFIKDDDATARDRLLVSFRQRCVKTGGNQFGFRFDGLTRMKSLSQVWCLPEAVGRPPGKVRSSISASEM